MAALRALLACVAGVAAGPVAESGSVEVVLASSHGDLAWLVDQSLPHRVTVYNQGPSLTVPDGVAADVVTLPNVGYEAHGYLHHIVNHYDSLAEKVVFMPGARPTTGFHGFGHGTGYLMPGVSMADYMDSDAPVFVPTMAVSSDLQQMSVRTSFMTASQEGADLARCSTDDWTPMMPNTFTTTVLEPFMKKQSEGQNFADFWSTHLGKMPLPETLRVAHGSVFAALRSDIHQRPKQFYEQLLEDVRNPRKAHVALFVQNMWWYIFHPAGEQPCSAAVAVNHRQLAPMLVLSPKPGDKLKFGTVYQVKWAARLPDTIDHCYQVELWRYGNFVTRLLECSTATQHDWLVSPDSADRAYLTQKMSNYKNDGTNGYRTEDGSLQPGDRYTVRVCDGKLDDDQPFDEQKCDDRYGEGGEFDIEPTTSMLEPACHTSYSAPANVQAVWTSYYVAGSTLTIQLYTLGNVLVFQETSIPNTGYYNFFATHDMPTDDYYFKISATCGDGCQNYWMGSGTTTMGVGCRFKITAAASPPSPPLSTEPFEVPIIKTFESGYNGFGGAAHTANTGITYGDFSDHAEMSCEDVCFAGRGRRRLLFGGLNNLGSPNGWLPDSAPCTTRQIQCGCSFCSQ